MGFEDLEKMKMTLRLEGFQFFRLRNPVSAEFGGLEKKGRERFWRGFYEVQKRSLDFFSREHLLVGIFGDSNFGVVWCFEVLCSFLQMVLE